MRTLFLGLTVVAGSLGGCAAAGPPSAEEVCFEREGHTCRRELVAGRLPRGTFDAACSDAALADHCAPAAFAECAPSRRALEACLDALSDFDRLATLPDLLPECQAPCLAFTT